MNKRKISSGGGNKLLQVVPSIAKEAGGVACYARDLCENLSLCGANGYFLTTSRSCAEELPINAPGFSIERVETDSRIFALAGASAVPRRAGEILSRGDVSVVHTHGLWRLAEHGAVKRARLAGVPYVISPHGMLEAWALNYGRNKKRVARLLFQNSDLRGATAFHVTCDDELRSLRDAGFSQPAAIVPPGVEIPDVVNPKKERRDGKRTALFLSRVHPKKGLIRLLQIWAKIRPVDWELVIAGNDEGGHRAELEKIVESLSLRDVVRFTGPVFDADKEALFQEADFFVLPTYSENFGIVVAEALVRKVPVLTTTGTPWSELNEADCGWCVGLEDEAVEEAMRMIFQLSDETLVRMRARGREHIIENYSWPVLAEKMVEFYRWVAGDAERPDFVRLD